MSRTQGFGLEIEKQTLKMLDGKLCDSLPEILRPDDRKNQLNTMVYGIINNNPNNNYDTIVEDLSSTTISTYKDHIIQVLHNNKDEFKYVVINALIDHCKRIDEFAKRKK